MTRNNELSDISTETLTQLKAQKGNRSLLGITVLLPVPYLERRLRAEELGHALEVGVGSPDLDLGSVPGLDALPPSYLGCVWLHGYHLKS